MAGARITIIGRGWPAGHAINVSWPDKGFAGPGQTHADASGAFSYSTSAPSDWGAGTHQVMLQDASPPGQSLMLSFQVTGGEQDNGPDPPPSYVCGGEQCGSPRQPAPPVVPPAPSPAQLAQFTKMSWELVDGYKLACDAAECTLIPQDISNVISKVSQGLTIVNLGAATYRFGVVSEDLRLLNESLERDNWEKPWSARTVQLKKTLWNDARALHETLLDVSPSMEAFFPVPPAK